MSAHTNGRSSSVRTHQRGVPKPLVIQACLGHARKSAPGEMKLSFAGSEPAISRFEWDNGPSYPESTWGTGLDDVSLHHLYMVVFIALPAQSSICKTPFKNLKAHPFRDCI